MMIVTARGTARLIAAILMTGWAALLCVTAPPVSAQPCPDVEVVFARGTGEPPGVGGVGQSFVDSLRAQSGGRTLAVYGVNYPASSDFSGGVDFARTVVDGIRDAGDHVQSTAANCPNTRIVLGGYSQGAAVAGFVTADAIPAEVPAEYASYIPAPLPAEVANHVAAVVLFGNPSAQFLSSAGAPAVTIGPLYEAKTLELCLPDDTICNGAPAGQPSIAHALYAFNGQTNEGAGYAASRL